MKKLVQHVSRALMLVSLLSAAWVAEADPYPPTLAVNGGLHFPVMPWPAEDPNPANCGLQCGEWKPYTRFRNEVTDPRVQDPSNGGTAPQNYVNISSSCTDKRLPSIYYALKQGATPDQDVIMFRWRVEQIANNYATGPSAGSYGATDPWSSALWSVLFDVDGDGYMDLAAHLDGSSGAPGVQIDRLAGVWGQLPTQSMDYLNNPAVKLIVHNPTALVDATSGKILNYQGTNTPSTTWTSGTTRWDYGTTRSQLVSSSPCNEYFVDYQIPVRMLDASSTGPNTALNGPKITRNTPISMLFCTANSLNNPFQKDCALNASWIGGVGKPAPFGDYLSFNKASAYTQPIVSSVTALAPQSCVAPSYKLTAKVQDTLFVNNGVVEPSIKSVQFFYWQDRDGDGTTAGDTGSAWTLAGTGVYQAGTLNTWAMDWNASALPKGRYLIGVQAVDDRTKHDLGVPDAPVDNRTFSYIIGSVDTLTQAQIYSNGWTWNGSSWAAGSPGWISGQDTVFPAHASAMAPVSTEDWYGNPDVTGTQIATTGVDLALNACGVAPTITKSVTNANIAVGGTTTFTVTVANNTGAAITLSRIDDLLPNGFLYKSTSSFTNGGAAVTGYTAPAADATGSVAWTFTPLTVNNGASVALSFVAQAGSVAGTYNNTATAATNYGTLTSSPVAVQVDAARLSLAKTPSTYSINPDGTTQLTYTMAYANDAAVDVTAATISDVLPSGVTFVSCSNSCTNTAGTLGWTLGTVAGGSSGAVTVTVTVNSDYSTSSLTNTATMAAKAPDNSTISASASATIAVNVTAAAFALTKVADVPQVGPGSNVTWTLAYKNYGSANASNVVLSDPLPSGFTFVSATPAASTAPTVGTNGTVSWNLGTVNSGTGGSVQVVAKAGNPFTGTSNPVTNTATLSWTKGSPVSATSQVGVTQSGQTCLKYYLQNTTTNVGVLTGNQIGTGTALSGNQYTATTTTPTGTAVVVSKSIAASGSPVETEIARFYQDPISSQLISFTGTSSLSGQIYYTKSGNTNLTMYARVYDYDPSTGTQVAIGSVSYTDNGSPTPPISLSSVVPTGSLSKGHRLLIVVSATLANNKAETLNVSVNSANSYVQLCAPAPANLVLQKSVDSSSLSQKGTSRTLTYTMKYANTSASTAASAVELKDVLPAGTTFVSATSNPLATPTTTPAVGSSGTVTWNFSSVAAGASGSVSVVVGVPDDLTGTSSISNTGTISSTETAPVNATALTEVVGGAGSASLVLSKAVSKTALTAGDTATYTLRVVNTGTAAASGVTVSDTLPSTGYFTYAGCSASVGTCSVSGSLLTWSAGNLAAGATATLAVTMNVATSGVPAGITLLNNHATVSDSGYCTGGTPPASCTSNTVTVSISGNPNLTLTKTSSVPQATVLAPGNEVTYTLTVSNAGSSSASGVVVYDPLPANMAYSAVVSAGPGAASFDALNNRMVFNIGNLAAGASATVAFKAKVSSLSSGSVQLLNTGSVTADNAATRTAQATNTAQAAPVMTLNKTGPASLPFPAAVLSDAVTSSDTVFVNSSALLEVGDWVQIVDGAGASLTRVTALNGPVVQLASAVTAQSGAAVRKAGTWSMSYQNTGNADATSVVVSDTLPANWVYVSAAPTVTSAPLPGVNGTVSWALGSVAPNASGVLQVVAIPTSTGQSTNTATLSAANHNTVQASATLATGGLTLSKATSTPTLPASVPGTHSVAKYTLTVSNSLASPVGGLSVRDLLPTGFTYVANSGKVNGAATEPAPGDLNQPAWTLLSVPAQGSLTITFDADIAETVGPATYQNQVVLENVPTGVASVPFDPLSTTAEDVTVLAANTGAVEGYVYRDANNNGSFDLAVDVPLPNVRVDITGSDTQAYQVVSDSAGYFRRVLPAGSTTLSIQGADIPAGLSLRAGQLASQAVTVPSGATVGKNTGYVPNAPILDVSKTHSGNFSAGGTGSYTVTVTNTGGLATSGEVMLTDTPPTGMTITGMSGTGWTCSSTPSWACTRSDALAAGASYPAITVGVSVSPSATSPLVNSVTASGGGAAQSASATDSTTVVRPAAFGISKSGPASAQTGAAITYTLTLTNLGELTTGTSATVREALPAGTVVTAVTAGTGVSTVACANYTSPFNCTVTLSAGLLPNGTATFTLAATAPATAGSITNYISVDPTGGSSPPDPTQTCVPTTACGSASTTLTSSAQPPAWQITKTHSGNFTAGGTGSYTVTVKNTGGTATSGTVTVGDTPPTGMTITGMSGTGWTCASAAPWSCTRSDALAAGASQEAIIVSVSVARDAVGTLTNSATVSGGGAAASATATDDTTVEPLADVVVHKNGPAVIAASGQLVYTVRVSNAGPGAANGTVFSDSVPAGVTGVSWTCGNAVGGAVCPAASGSGNAISQTLATFPAGGSVTYTMRGTAPTSGSVTNVASASVAVGVNDPDTANNTSSVTTQVGSVAATADLSVVKYGPSAVAAGASTRYVLVVTNAGPAHADGAVLTDVLPTGASNLSWTCDSAVGGAVCPNASAARR